MDKRARYQRPLACAAASILIFGMAAPAAAAPGDAITLADQALSDSGALAADPARGVYWTASGSGAVQAINVDGSTAGEVTYAADAAGVQALAYFDGLLYVGDIGGSRSSVDIYRLEALDYGTAAPLSHWTLHYPDGAHDAMTMMVSPKGNIWIVTKGSPGGLYYAEAPGAVGEITMEYMAEAPEWVTDGVFLDAETAVLRTYNSVLSFDMLNYAVTASEAAPEQPQGESIAMSLNASSVLLGSRGSDQLVEAAVPSTMSDVGQAPSAPPGAAEPTTSAPEESSSPAESESTEASAEPSGEESELPKPTRSRGTMTAVAIAALVSVAAGAIAYLTSKTQSKKYRKRH